jgi:hypothetical protein
MWVLHLLGAVVAIQPVRQIRDERRIWHLGLDAEASAILNDLWHGRAVDEARRAHLLVRFRLEFRDPEDRLARVPGRPGLPSLATTGAGRLKLTAQNFLINLPLAGPARAQGGDLDG